MIRIYQNFPLSDNAVIDLDTAASHHVARVLRAQIGEKLVIFNGQGGEYPADIIGIDKKKVTIKTQLFSPRCVESPLNVCLAQGISRSEKMDFTIQKAVELGVKCIVPLLTERTTIKLKEERSQKRVEHWQSVIVSACEQSGRNILPKLLPPQLLSSWLPSAKADERFVLSPTARRKLSTFQVANNASVIVLVGPEGGLSDKEIHIANQHGFAELNLGPRILRTETAGLAVLSALQSCFGDLGS